MAAGDGAGHAGAGDGLQAPRRPSWGSTFGAGSRSADRLTPQPWAAPDPAPLTPPRGSGVRARHLFLWVR